MTNNYQNNNLLLKISLLSVGFVTASVNAIAGNIPEIASSFPDVPIHIIELMTTIPSFTMMLAILFSHYLSDLIGAKKTILFACLLCAISGSLPFLIQNIFIMIITRALFGFGVGAINAMLLNLIIYFFNGKTRSQMIGLQGSIGGLGSLVTTFIAGRLLVFGWHVSFLTYLFGFIIFILVLLGVPSVKSITVNQEHTNNNKNWLPIIFYSLMSFTSVCLATFFVIKGSTLVIENNYGSVQDGSTIIMLISLGSLLAGAMYGNIYNKIKNKSLILFYLICLIAFIIGGFSHQLLLTFVAAFLLGYGYMAFVPFLQEKAGRYGYLGTTTLLIFQSLGSFIAPYFGTLLNNFTTTLSNQFIITGFIYFILMIIAILMDLKNKNS